LSAAPAVDAAAIPSPRRRAIPLTVVR
jgi:hypothetical protein